MEDGQRGKLGALVQVVAMLLDTVSDFATIHLHASVVNSAMVLEWRQPNVIFLVKVLQKANNGLMNPEYANVGAVLLQLPELLLLSVECALTLAIVMASGPSSTLELQIIPNSSGFEKDSGIINNVVETDLLNVCIFHYSFVRSEHLRSYLIGEKWLSLKEALHVGLTASISAVVFIGLSVVTLLCMRKRLGKFFHSVANSKGKTSLMNTSICKVALLESTHSCGENVHSSDYLPPEMMNSTRTQMTQMSVEDRSKSEEPKASWSRMAIVSPRDRLPSRDGTANQRDGAEKSVPSSFKRTDSTSQLSFVENEQEFEYDYYDAPVMGSILNPLQPWELIDNDFDFCSE
uniref:Uncharacterized protein n=2 Tax=Trichuris muris TaxID=70415 RepID=A0A5S6R0A6_TRIMR